MGASSTANDLVKASNPPFAAVYAGSPGLARGPAIEVIFIKDPFVC